MQRFFHHIDNGELLRFRLKQIRWRSSRSLRICAHLSAGCGRLYRLVHDAARDGVRPAVRTRQQACPADHDVLLGQLGLPRLNQIRFRIILVEDQMRIVAAETEIANSCAANSVTRLPRCGLPQNCHTVPASNFDQVTSNRCRRQGFALERFGQLEEAGQARRRDEMPCIGLQGSDGEIFVACEHVRRCLHLDTVTSRRAGRMAFQIGHALRIHARHCVCARHGFSLALAGRGEQTLAPTIIREADAPDNAVNDILLLHIRQTFQDNRDRSFRWH